MALNKVVNKLAKSRSDITKTFKLYEDGKNYNIKLNLYNINDINEKFYAGEQWDGLNAPGMPTPVFNIYKRVIDYFTSSILQQPITIEYIAELIGDDPQDEKEAQQQEVMQFATAYAKRLWERLKMDSNNRQLLLDAANTGDMAGYCWWDETIDTGQDAEGDIEFERLDGVTVYFGNPNESRTSRQPYIIVAFREMVEALRQEAKASGQPEDVVRKIVSDEETEYTAGSRGKIEIDNEKNNSGKTTALLKLYKKREKVDGKTVTKVYAEKVTQYAEVRKEWDTKLTEYPIPFNNWTKRKNSYHGQALGTEIRPNQIYINQQFALVMIAMREMGFPKVIYDKTKISAWSNKVGGAFGVNGSTLDVARYMTPSQINQQMLSTIDLAISYTKEFLGANDAALGDVNPNNATALAIVTKQAAVPLENIRANLYQFIEDTAKIWLDFMANYYGKRKISVEIMGKKVVKEIDFSLLKDIKTNVKINVGTSTLWSENASDETLDNLLREGYIQYAQWLQHISSAKVPNKQQMIEENQANDAREQFRQEMMIQFFQSLPPEMQQEIQGLSEEEAELRIMEMAKELPQEEPQDIEENII